MGATIPVPSRGAEWSTNSGRLAMRRQNRIRIMEFAWPLFAVFAFILEGKRFLPGGSIRGFKEEPTGRCGTTSRQTSISCTPKGRPIEEKRTQVLPFDYASVCIVLGNVRFCFTRGRGETKSLGPRHALDDSYDLAVVIAALDSKDITEVTQLSDLADGGDLLRARLDDLNDAFSESQYPEFKSKFSRVKENVRVLTRQAEWELNKRLYH
jgi:hypothetical protein